MIEPVIVEPNTFVHMMELIFIGVIIIAAIVIVYTLRGWGLVLIVVGVIAVVLLMRFVQSQPLLNDLVTVFMNWGLRFTCMAEC
jgi:hypothetical protein